MIVAPLAVFAGGSYLGYRATLADARTSVTRLLSIADLQANRVFDSAQLIGLWVNEIVGDQDDADIAAQEQALHDRLGARIRDLPQIQSVMVVGRTGRPLFITTQYPVDPALDLSDRDYFRAIRDAGAAFYIGTADVGRLNAHAFVPIAIPKGRLAGGFGGVIVVSLSPEYFRAYYDALVDDSPDYAGGVFRMDGGVLGRYPAVGAPPLSLGSDDAMMREIADNSPRRHDRRPLVGRRGRPPGWLPQACELSGLCQRWPQRRLGPARVARRDGAASDFRHSGDLGSDHAVPDGDAGDRA
ncbi:MAG: hypothetical protein WDO24_03805 [Pseudomonadota bacterium]